MKSLLYFVAVVAIFTVTVNLFPGETPPKTKKLPADKPESISHNTVRELTWENLIPLDLTRAQMRKGKRIDEDKMFGIVYDTEIFKGCAELDGQIVRLCGFTLPLEMVGDEVIEFLLVPYVGACIHVPPPPPIQMIYVKLLSGYKCRSLYDAVWVTGRMAIKNANYELYFVDGEENIQVGYSMEATEIEPVILGNPKNR